MSEAYLREIKGKRWIEPAQWAKKHKAEDVAFRARLASLPKAEAVALCQEFLADMTLRDTSGKLICAEYLAANT